MIDLGEVMRILWRRRLIIASFTALGLLYSAYQLRTATFAYDAELKVAAAQTGNGSQPQTLGGLSGLAAQAGLSLGQSNPASGLSLYKEGIKSRSVAERLARDPAVLRRIFGGEWNAELGRYVEPRRGIGGRTSAAIKRVLGVPPTRWTPPGPARMQEYIRNAIKIVDDPVSGIITISYAHPDPVFAASFLMRVHAVADGNLRDRARARATQYVGYLSAQLQQVTLAEHRAAIAAALSDQEKARMAASSTMAFVAEPVDVATPSLTTTTPRPSVIVMVGLVGGFIFGIVAALLSTLVRPGRV